MDAGTVTNGFYRNKTLGLTCKIPPGWVLRTDEMNAREESKKKEEQAKEGEKESKDIRGSATRGLDREL